EQRRQLLVIGRRNPPVVHHPFTVAEHAVDAPVDEQPEARVLEPLASREVDDAWTIGRLRASGAGSRQRHRARSDQQTDVLADAHIAPHDTGAADYITELKARGRGGKGFSNPARPMSRRIRVLA